MASTMSTWHSNQLSYTPVYKSAGFHYYCVIMESRTLFLRCPQRDLNPHSFWELRPERSASTDSAMWAGDLGLSWQSGCQVPVNGLEPLASAM